MTRIVASIQPADDAWEPSALMQERVDQLLNVLPAKTRAQIRKRTRWSPGTVGTVLQHLRNHVDYYGWTVPHAARGHGHDQDRFFAVRLDSGGEPFMDPPAIQTVRQGFRSTLKSIAALGRHESRAIALHAPYEPNTMLQRWEQELADDLGYVARKAAAILAELRDAEAQANGG